MRSMRGRLSNISGQRFFASLTMTEPSRSLMRGRNSAHHSQIILIPRRGNTFASGVRPGFIGTGGNALLAQFAHVPVVLVDYVPELNGIFRIKIAALERFRIKEPVAEDQCSFR